MKRTTQQYPKVKVYMFNPDVNGEFEVKGRLLYGFNKDAVDYTDLETARAKKLFAAIDADVDDDEYILGELPDGRWAVIGLTAQGHPFAIEKKEEK